MQEHEKKYLQGLIDGREEIFRLVMDTYYVRLYNFANGYLHNSEDTKEVLQDVFLKLWDTRKKLLAETNLNAYLFTITRNRCIDLIRRERLMLQFRSDKQQEYNRLTENFDALSDPILDNLFAREVLAEINNAINKLPEQCRKVFLLSRNNGLKNREISEKMGLSEKTVESHLTKALKTIKLLLEKKFPGSLNLFSLFSITTSH